MWQIVVNLRTEFLRVGNFLCLSANCSTLIDINDVPNQPFGIPDLDLSEDPCNEALTGPKTRLANAPWAERLDRSWRASGRKNKLALVKADGKDILRVSLAHQQAKSEEF